MCVKLRLECVTKDKLMQIKKKILILLVIFLLMIASLVIGMLSNQCPAGKAQETAGLKIDPGR